MTQSDTPVHVRDEPYRWVRARHGATIAHLLPLSMTTSANPPALCRTRIRGPQVPDRQSPCQTCLQHVSRVRLQN